MADANDSSGSSSGGEDGDVARRAASTETDILPTEQRHLLSDAEPRILRLLSRLRSQKQRGGGGGGRHTAAEGRDAQHIAVQIPPEERSRGSGHSGGSGRADSSATLPPDISLSASERGHVVDALREHRTASRASPPLREL